MKGYIKGMAKVDWDTLDYEIRKHKEANMSAETAQVLSAQEQAIVDGKER